MSTNILEVSKEWLDQFHEKNIEYITTIDNRELFTEVFNGEFPGNQFNYETVFKIIEAFISSYHFIKIDYIRLIWGEKLAENNLQFLKNDEDYSLWKEKILEYNFEIDTTHFPDIEDSTDIFCNYSIAVDGEERILYQSINDRIAIHLFFNEIKNSTQYSITMEFRKSLFMVDSHFDNNLPESCIEFNNHSKTNASREILEKLESYKNYLITLQ